jgi:hypothetical protein
MSNLKVSIDHILSITEAKTGFNNLIEKIESDTEGVFILTKGGSPAAALVNIPYLERLLGKQLAVGVTTSEPEKVVEYAKPPVTETLEQTEAPSTSPINENLKNEQAMAPQFGRVIEPAPMRKTTTSFVALETEVASVQPRHVPPVQEPPATTDLPSLLPSLDPYDAIDDEDNLFPQKPYFY